MLKPYARPGPSRPGPAARVRLGTTSALGHQLPSFAFSASGTRFQILHFDRKIFGRETDATGPAGAASRPVSVDSSVARDREGDTEGARSVLAAAPAGGKPKVAVVYYSLYGHIKLMADEIKTGLEAVHADLE